MCFFGAVLLPLVAVLLDFAADGAFVAVKLFGDFGDGALEGQVLDGYRSSWVSCVWLIWKVALQIRIRRRLKTDRERIPKLKGFDLKLIHYT